MVYGTGKDPYKSRFQLWLEKTTDFAPPTVEPEAPPRPNHGQDANRLAWGSRVEPVLRDWLAGKLGRAITVPTQTYWMETQDFGGQPYMLGNLDGLTAAPMEVVECKTVDKYQAAEWGDPGTDAVPVRTVMQVTHYMLVTGLKTRAHVGVLVGGNDARYYTVPWDPEVGELLLARAKAFWQHVVDKTPPEITNLDDAAARWPTSVERGIRADSKVSTQLLELTHQRRTQAAAEKKGDELEVLIKAYMGEASMLTDTRGRALATWRTETQNRLDSKRLAEEHPQLAAEYRKQISFRKFHIK